MLVDKGELLARHKNDAFPQSDFCGVQFVVAGENELVDAVLEVGKKPPQNGFIVHLIPVHSIVDAHQDKHFHAALNTPGFTIPDGRWIELLTRQSSNPLTQVRGSDLLMKILDRGRENGIGHYLLGPGEDVLTALEGVIERKFPGAALCGSAVFPFGALSTEEKANIVANIRQASPQLVWFGISSPRQNKEAQWISEQTGSVVICVGAAFEFVAGVKKTAPIWVQRLGAEWLFRFLSEPARLWRRYLLGSAQFIRLYITKEVFGQKRQL